MKIEVTYNLLRNLFDFALTGNYSVEALVRKAKEIGIRGKNGNPICKSRMHKHLRDPFYTGRFIYTGKIYKGQHPAMLTDEEFNLLQDILDGKSKGRQRKHDFALKGIIKCGECNYCITGEEQTKKYKNGSSKVFSYYRCTKKGKDENKKCNQGYLATFKLEGQFNSELSQLELDQKFADWAFEALEEPKDKESSINRDSYEALQAALEGVNRKIDNLTSLIISPGNSDGSLLSNQEFSDRKRGLLIEKEEITNKLSKIDPNNSEWAELGKESFDFALLASKRFENGLSDDKRIIFTTVGSNPILLDQNLKFQLRYLFLRYKQGIKSTKDEIKRLEPKISPSDQANLKNFVKSSIWCGQEDSNLRPKG